MDEAVIYPEWRSSSELITDGMRPYEPTNRLRELIDGKTVAYICPSPHLIGEHLGSFIDEHCVVIRAGNLSAIPEKMHADYGKRTDILVHSFNYIEIGEAKRNLSFLQSLKYILCPMVSTTFSEQHNEWMEYLNNRICPSEKVHDQCLFHLFREIGTIANVGLAGLATILKYNPIHVYVAGMSFYNMGAYGRVYNDDYYDMVTTRERLYDGNEQKTTSPQQARSDIHDQGSQIRYMQKLITNDKRIKPDNFLRQHFNCSSLND